MQTSPGAPPSTLEANRRVTRIIAFALWMAVWIYVFIFVQQVLQGRAIGFLAPLGSVPWDNPMTVILAAVGVMDIPVAILLRHRLLEQAARAPEGPQRWALERSGMIIGYALLEAIAIFGLVLGFALHNPAVAPLSGLMFLVPLIGQPLLLPPHARSGATADDGAIRPS
ncbi:MAG TPA: hypothetical protein VJ600_07285 [Holophagaceae bacterium]|nr:hypothetical protein [Holophagaceae bacterium]